MILDEVLEKTLKEKELSNQEVIYLLEQTNQSQVNKISKAARLLREKYFFNKVFLYGFVYFSTYCKNNCNFCYYRESNINAPRYRKSIEEIVNIAKELKKSGVHLIDLTMGEDQYFHLHPQKLIEIVKRIKSETHLPMMISPGVVSNELIFDLMNAGVDWYALYQETHNKELFQTLRINQDYDERLRAKKYAKKTGMLIEEGLLAGVGNTLFDTAQSFEVMKEINASQVRTMTFIPQQGTPMESIKQKSFLSELLNISVMRLIFPKALIPASLDVDGLSGLEERLNAGANVVTSIIPPEKGFAGVANAYCDINEGYRTVNGIQKTLKKCGLQNATEKEYKNWLENRKRELSINN